MINFMDIIMIILLTTSGVVAFIGITGNIGWEILEKDPIKINTKIGNFLFTMMYWLEVQENLF